MQNELNLKELASIVLKISFLKINYLCMILARLWVFHKDKSLI